MAGRIFISHASADAELAEGLTTLLRLGGVAEHGEVFCTSLEEMGVPTGKNFVEHIRGELEGSPLVVQIITPAYLESVFCLCELGAQWVLAKDAFPFTVPPITNADLQGVQSQIQIGRIDDGADLDQLFDRVRKTFGREPGTVAWNKQREAFLARLKPLLTDLRGWTKVDAAKYEGVVAAYEAETGRVKALRAENEALKEKLLAMGKAKDATERKQILVSGDERAEFNALVDTAQNEVLPLPSIVMEALYAWAADLDFNPSDWDDPRIDEAITDGLIDRVDVFDGVELELNRSDPKVGRAIDALDELKAFDPSTEFEAAFTHEHDLAFDMANRRVLKALGIG